MQLILASGSPRRAELLRAVRLQFVVDSPDIDESRHPEEEPHAYVERLARGKARAGVRPNAVSLGADTVIVHHSAVMGKPAHPSEARTMLRRLSGEEHQVLSGVAVAAFQGEEVVIDSAVESATVRFAQLTDDEIDAYVATGEPLDRAGAYAIQERGGVFVDAIVGHPTTVIGLPLPTVRRLLARHGIVVVA